MAQLVQMLNARMIVSLINRLHPMKPNIPHITDVTHVTHLTPPRLFPCLCLVFVLSLPTLAGLSPERLRCEYLDNTVGACL